VAEDGDKSAQKARLAQAMAVVSFTKTIDQAREREGEGAGGREWGAGEGGRVENRGCHRKFALTTLVVLTDDNSNTTGNRQGVDDISNTIATQ
jgi:hypothetical protein